MELEILVGDAFHVETDGGNGGDDFADLEAVQDCGFAGSVQTEDEDTDLLGAEDGGEDAGEDSSHRVVVSVLLL